MLAEDEAEWTGWKAQWSVGEETGRDLPSRRTKLLSKAFRKGEYCFIFGGSARPLLGQT